MTEYEEKITELIVELEGLGYPYIIHKQYPFPRGDYLQGYYVGVFVNNTWVTGGSHPKLDDAIQNTLDAVKMRVP